MKKFFDIVGTVLIMIFMAFAILGTLNAQLGFLPIGFLTDAVLAILKFGPLVIVAWFTTRMIFVGKSVTLKVFLCIFFVLTIVCYITPLVDLIFSLF